jgi:ubiquinone/menaquinone biosynthesis C-methylase UbiE
MASGLADEGSHLHPAPEAYALWAETYDTGANPLLALEERTMGPLLPHLKGKTVLDLACGTGRWLERLFQRGASRGFGTDLSAEMLGVASTKPLLSGKLLRSEGGTTPVRDGTVDLTVCSFGLSYMANVSPLARDLGRISRSGADVFISDFHPEGYERGWKRTFRYKDRVIEIASFAHAIKAVCDAFLNAGFTLIHCVEPMIGEPERKLFVQAGKHELYDSAREWPAIFILHFHLCAMGGDPANSK